MVFYDDFVKKINNTKIEYQKSKKYSLEVRKKISMLGTSIPLIIIGIFQTYIGYLEKNKVAYYIVAVVLICLGIKNMKNIFSYKIILDSEKGKLINKDINLSFEDIETCTLMEMVVGKSKKIQTVIRIVTKEKKEILIPLMMNNKIDFVCRLKSIVNDKFEIKK